MLFQAAQASISVVLQSDIEGINLVTSGFSESIGPLTRHLFGKLQSFDPQNMAERFEDIRVEMIKETMNSQKKAPYE